MNARNREVTRASDPEPLPLPKKKETHPATVGLVEIKEKYQNLQMGVGHIEGIRCIKGAGEITRQGEDVRAPSRYQYLGPWEKAHAHVRTMITRPGLQSLGQDAPPSPALFPAPPTPLLLVSMVGGASAAFAYRSASL